MKFLHKSQSKINLSHILHFFIFPYFISNKLHNDDWMDYLSTGRVEKIKEKIKEFKDNDNYVSKIIYTELPDKLDIISKLKLLNISRKELKKQFNEIT